MHEGLAPWRIQQQPEALHKHCIQHGPMGYGAPAVIEIYSEWCGPCLSVLPTFKRIRLEKDDPACLTFLMVRSINGAIP